MKTEWYTGTQADVQAYIDAMNGSPVFPLEEPGGYKAEKWFDKAIECADGSFCCPRPPQWLLDHHEISQDLRGAITSNFVENKLTAHEDMPEIIEE